MDAKYFKILSFLYDKGIGEYVNISPVLLELYPDVNRMDFVRAGYESGRVRQLLISMTQNGLIEVKQYSIGGGNRSVGVDWIDTVQIMATITQQGKDSVDAEKEKGETIRLMESTILTNESVRETNDATVQNLHFQRKAQTWTIILGALSMIFISITVIQTAISRTEQELKGIERQMTRQSQAIQLLDSSLQEINYSIQDKKTDTVFLIRNK
ncbi:MAG: hypothetical protein EPN37_00960 [Chitinophagaceae bacterium]|nr:MAG: hypothetical protein EPN37_00960 [Chitinophagaceae bacterium]